MPLFLDRLDQLVPFGYLYYVFDPIENMAADPDVDATRRRCHSQKIRSTGHYQNFDFVAIILVVALSTLVIATSLLLELLVGLFRSRHSRDEGNEKVQARQLARDFDGKFWLLGAAVAGRGGGLWIRGGKKSNSSIPIV